MPPSDTELLDALSALLPAQFEALLLRAKVPAAYLPSGVAPPPTRAPDVGRWVRQDPARRRLLVEDALRKVHGAAAAIAPEPLASGAIPPPTARPR